MELELKLESELDWGLQLKKLNEELEEELEEEHLYLSLAVFFVMDLSLRFLFFSIIYKHTKTKYNDEEHSVSITIVRVVWLRVVWGNHNSESDMNESGMGESQ